MKHKQANKTVINDFTSPYRYVKVLKLSKISSRIKSVEPSLENDVKSRRSKNLKSLLP